MPNAEHVPELTEDVIEQFDQTTSADLPQLEAYIKIWSKAVDTQMHFNEMSVRSRQLGLTFVVTALGLAALLISQGKDEFIPVGGPYRFPVSSAITLVAAGALWLVRSLDIGVYHRMLRGAVAFGEDFERTNLTPQIGVLKGMTSAVSLFSRHEDVRLGEHVLGPQDDASLKEGTKQYGYYVQKERRRLNPFTWSFSSSYPWLIKPPVRPLSAATEMSAERKLRRFYTSTIGVLILLAVLVGFARGFTTPPSGAKDIAVSQVDTATGAQANSAAQPPGQTKKHNVGAATEATPSAPVSTPVQCVSGSADE